MQPVQLSLIPDPTPAPPAPADSSVGDLPAEAVATATALLAGVIAKAAAAGETGAICDE